jgi:hypothetical protein
VPIAAGKGKLWRCLGSSSNCERHFDEENGGWHVSCLARNADACEARVAALRDREVAERQAAAERAAAVRALEKEFETQGVWPEPPQGQQIFIPGEEVPVSGCRNRIYGGGLWTVVEPAGERIAPPAADVEAARADLGSRTTALQAAMAALVAWTSAHLPAHAPCRRMNGGRPPSDGKLWGADLKQLDEVARSAYDALLAEEQRLSYTSSPDSYHHAGHRVAALELAASLASYPRSIWLVRGNGSDGDNWAPNNVRTGGAGAIGRRLPWTPELEARVRALREEGL